MEEVKEIEMFKETKKTRLGVQLIAGYTWLGAFIFGFFAVIVLMMLIQDPGASGISVGILGLTVLTLFAYLFGKLAIMTSEMKSTAWWAQMLLLAFSLLSLNPIALIIMIYLWINRESFGIPTNKGSTDY